MHSVVLRYLDEVVRQGSFRKAGAVLNVTSSALNRQILKLETELGLRLFDRRSDGVELTSAGKVILDHARETLFSYERVRARISAIKDMREGEITVSCINSLMFRLLPDIVSKFVAKYPDVTFTVRNDTAEGVLQALEDESVDIGLTFSHFNHPGVRMINEIPAPFGAIVSPDHALAERSSATLEECLAFPVVRTFDPTGRHMFVEIEAKKLGLSVTPCFYTNSMVMAINVIKIGIGIGIYMRHGVIDEIENGSVRFIPLTDSELSNYRIGLFISSRKFLNKPERAFVDISDNIINGHLA